jgi:hypothetical protein
MQVAVICYSTPRPSKVLQHSRFGVTPAVTPLLSRIAVPAGRCARGCTAAFILTPNWALGDLMQLKIT